MKICDVCKKEYDDHLGNCPECGAGDTNSDSNGEKWIVLTNVANDIEYELIKGVLDLGDIPVVKNIKGIDGYLAIFTGSPILQGIDILVPESRFEEATQLLNASIDEPESEIEDE